MIKTWSIEYCPIPDKYLLMIWLNDKSYYLDISREFAEMLGGACIAESLFQQDQRNEIERLKAENAALCERLGKAVELPCKIGDKVYMPWVYDGISGIAEITALSITIFDGEFICDTDLASDDINFKQEYSYGQFRDFDFGTKVFTTRKAAEACLSELKGEKGCAKT